MRRERRIPPPRGFRTSDRLRLGSMILMLAVLYALINYARDPSVWRWFAEDSDAGTPARAVESPAPKHPPSPKVDTGANRAGQAPESSVQRGPSQGKVGEAKAAVGASLTSGEASRSAVQADQGPEKPSSEEAIPRGPTDEDPEERSAAEEEFQAITDKTLEIQPIEMVPYRRVLQWVLNQPASVMRRRARTDVAFNDLMLWPDKYRGTLVELVLNARLIRPCDLQAPDGSDLYEVWGFTSDSGTWLYCAVVVGLPEGMPVGTRISEQVRVVGYFFKLQGYHEAGAKPHAPPLAAPMLLGRLIWIQPPAPVERTWEPSWSLLLVATVSAVLLAQLAWLVVRARRRRPPRRTTPSPPQSGSVAIDQWFEQARQGTAPIPEAPGPDDLRPSPQGHEGNGRPERLVHPLDGGLQTDG